MSEAKKITILGAGISGITTGVVLQLLGYNTQILTKERADQPRNSDNPAFASLYPSASVIPHSVFGHEVLSLFDTSQRVFEVLLQEQAEGLSVNQHFEVFEYEKEAPGYAAAMKNFRPLAKPWQSTKNIPHHPDTNTLNGWSFDCFFADWPIYLPQLFQWYQQLGGEITIKKIEPRDIQRLSSPIVNCTGLAGRHLFGDADTEHVVLKGHLVHVKNAPDITNKLGQSISYNYNPTPQIYSDAEGNTQDVYCYPRKDGWIIGGSRLAGRVDENGKWTGIKAGGDTISVNGTSVPAPIIKLNREILNHSYNLDLDDYSDREVLVGYRFIRNTKNGLRLEKSKELGTPVIHNYGHGGAGVTLSWGCALRVAGLLVDDIPAPNRGKNRSLPLFKTLQTEFTEILQGNNLIGFR